jgi:RNA polymerase sigma factor (sigma-70 family)
MSTTPLSLEQRDLVEKNIGLVESFVRRKCGKRLDRDDFRQECSMMLIYAASTWEPKRGAFSTWAFLAMRNAYRRTLRMGSVVGFGHSELKVVSLSEQFDEEGLSLEERLGDPRAIIADTELDTRRRARAALPSNPRQRDILLRRADGDTLEEIGNDMALSRERVRQIEEVALSSARCRIGTETTLSLNIFAPFG